MMKILYHTVAKMVEMKQCKSNGIKKHYCRGVFEKIEENNYQRKSIFFRFEDNKAISVNKEKNMRTCFENNELV